MSDQSNAPAASLFQGKTVLIADDDPTIREYLSAHCSQIGLRVRTAGDGLQTLLRVSSEDPDILILDLHLPDVEGYRVCERLMDQKFRPLPVIMLTGSTDEETKRRCQEFGALYIQKSPRLWEELASAMHRIFEGRDANCKPPRRLPGR